MMMMMIVMVMMMVMMMVTMNDDGDHGDHDNDYDDVFTLAQFPENLARGRHGLGIQGTIERSFKK